MLIYSPRTRVNPPPLHIHLSGSEIEQVSSFKLLGMLINDTLTWINHINHVATKVGCGMNLLWRLSWFLPRSLLVLYLNSYILPVVDYCDVVWDNCTQHDSSRLQSLFNYACHLVLHRPRLSSSSALWKEHILHHCIIISLRFTSLHCRRRLHLAELIYNVTIHLLLPISHPSSVFPLTTTARTSWTSPHIWTICSRISWCIAVAISTCLTTWFWIPEDLLESCILLLWLTHMTLSFYIYSAFQTNLHDSYLFESQNNLSFVTWMSIHCMPRILNFLLFVCSFSCFCSCLFVYCIVQGA